MRDIFLYIDPRISLEELESKYQFNTSQDFLRFRIENLLPEFKFDLMNNIIAPDIPLENYLAAGKGCYAGQEVVEMATARGRPNRKLVKIKGRNVGCDSRTLYADGTEIGILTSMSSTNDGFIALAIIKNKSFSGQEIYLQNGNEKYLVEITCDSE